MSKPSARMMTVMKDIVSKLEISFEGDNDKFEDVSKFIGDHIDKLRELRQNEPATHKQLKMIEWIVSVDPGLSFDGTTKKEASEFIDSNVYVIKESKR